MKRLICIAILLLAGITALPPPLTAGGAGFAPWGRQTWAGDERFHEIHSRVKAPSGNGVYGGPQAAAYSLIRFFQIVISTQDGPHCRFEPVCSAYGRKAVSRYGAILGSMLAGDRIIRCNPFNAPGPDPVPGSLDSHR